MWTLAGRDAKVQIEYLVDGDFIVPSSATAYLMNSSGSQLASYVLDVTGTSTVLTIPSSFITIGSGKTLDSVWLDVNIDELAWTRVTIQIHPFIPLSVAPAHVRAELGLDRTELPDDQIDLIAAYFLLLDGYGSAVSTALTAGDTTTLMVNTAVGVRAALEIIGSIQFRAFVKMKAEENELSRMGTFKVDEVKARLEGRLNSLMGKITGTAELGTVTFLLSSPTDVITGA